MIRMFNREERLKTTLREFKYMDKSELKRHERKTLNDAINVLTRHLRMRNLNFHDEEFDCLATALQLKTLTNPKRQGRVRFK